LNNNLSNFYDLFHDNKQMAELLQRSFAKTQEEIENASFDVTFSGTTANIVMIYSNLLICANVGDSRSVLFTKSKSTSTQAWQYFDLSTDHKLNIEREKDRIIKFNGKVERLQGSLTKIKMENIMGL